MAEKDKGIIGSARAWYRRKKKELTAPVKARGTSVSPKTRKMLQDLERGEAEAYGTGGRKKR